MPKAWTGKIFRKENHCFVPVLTEEMCIRDSCRPNHEFRGFQGQIENGAIRAGDLVTTLPSKEEAHVKSILDVYKRQRLI